ncbi:MAG: extracellular solute-binding protein [Patescibacteria group bacterium]|nr:extracellular solute-binding protein [Patescibacteria group bacterium]
MRNKLLILLLIFSFILTSGFGCKGADKETQEAMKPVTLNYWRVWDGPDAFAEIIANYKALHPYVNINYRKLRYSEYEKELLEALAEDKGPDILSLHNTWIKKYQSKLASLPPEITMVYPVEKGTIKKEIAQELKTTKSLNFRDLKNNFVDAVYDDVILSVADGETGKTGEKIFGLPLALDTLVMYYNRDLLNNAGIAEPPTYWNEEFQQAVKKLTKQDSSGQIIQSGVALGGSKNIERYSDILSILMMQNGAVMADESGNITFNQIPEALAKEKYSPGLEALRFYTDFSNPAKEVYCWNNNLENSLEMFIAGKLAIFFGYAYHLPTIEARAPKLNFAIAKLPQIEGNLGNINFANYWVEAVSNKSKYINEAWDFVQFATGAEQAKFYLTKTKKPTALRSLVSQQIEDEDISIFASEILTARSWYRGEDANAAELIIGEMIDSTVAGEGKIEEIINLGARRVQQTVIK